jgi:hypothetical protein
MEDFANRYGSHFAKLVDSGASGKVFEFDQVLLRTVTFCKRARGHERQSRSGIGLYSGDVVLSFFCYVLKC